MAVSEPLRASRRGWALAVIAAAQFMVIMDTSIIGVALPQIQADLGFSPADLSWVFNAYVVALGGLLLLGGRLSDLFGARRVFAIGWVVLLVGSAVAGAAGSVAVELIGRAVQGAGAALIAPAALALLMMLFGAEPRGLTKALALYGAAAPAGGTAGVFLGGVITEYVSWPWVFYINIPVAVVALVLTPLLMPAGGARTGTIDIAGAVTVTGGLAAAVYAIVRAPQIGWGSAQTWLVLAAAVVLLGVFVAIQATRREPLMRLSIFRTPNLAAANVAQLLLGAAWIPMWFFLNLYLQQVLGYSAFPSGAALLPMTILIMLGMIVLAPRLIARFGPKAMTVTGLALLAVGMAGLSLIRPTGSFWVDVLPASLVAALGMSLAFIPSLGTAISSARPEEGGLASGIVNTSYQVGSALGLAAMTAVAASRGAEQLGNRPALTTGFSAAFIGAACIAAAGAIIAAATFRRTATGGAATEAEPDQRGKDGPVLGEETVPAGYSQQLSDDAVVAPSTAGSGNGREHTAQTPAPVGAGWQPLIDDHGGAVGPAHPPVAPVTLTKVGAQSMASTSTGSGSTLPDSLEAHVRGRVRRPDGGGVAGAALTLIDFSGHQVGRCSAGPDGGYQLEVPTAGIYVLIASAGAHQPEASTVVIGDDPVEVELVLTGTASLAGTVTAASSGAPITGAATTLADGRGEVVGASMTGSDGGYRLGTLVAGTYTLVVSADSFQPIAQAVTVPETGQAYQDVTLAGGARLHGIARSGATNRPVSDARVTLLDGVGKLTATTDTDEAGQYSFSDLDAGEYTLVVSGYPAVTSSVHVNGHYDQHDVELGHLPTHPVHETDVVSTRSNSDD